jgi:hypothetical protein
VDEVRSFERAAANTCIQAYTWLIEHHDRLDRKIQTDCVLNLGKFAKSDDEQRDVTTAIAGRPASLAVAQHAIGLKVIQ